MILIRKLPTPITAARRISLVASRRLLAKRRWRARAEDGQEFGFDLSTPLKPGEFFHLEGDIAYVVKLEPEPVIEVPWSDWAEAALIGWHIGNLHQAVEVREDGFRVADDPAIHQLLEQKGWRSQTDIAEFQPMAAMTAPHAS